ncbi:hypothetical protein TYRP_002724 [Tyrophagus putrescentiae]|nr:hypothetical protein TYRP_002724 [Tyrophagus putrescentiae]
MESTVTFLSFLSLVAMIITFPTISTTSMMSTESRRRVLLQVKGHLLANDHVLSNPIPIGKCHFDITTTLPHD